jgi:hypothetical protein
MKGLLLFYLLETNHPSLISDEGVFAWRDPSSDDCVMHIAASRFPVALASLLETKGGQALMNHANKQKQTPLFFAAFHKQVECVRLLMWYGAHFNCDFFALMCPLQVGCYGFGDKNEEVAIAMMSGAPTCEKRIDFVRSHLHGAMGNYRSFLLRCLLKIDSRRRNAQKAIGALVFVLKQRMGKSQKDVFRQILIPMLCYIWERRRYEACWDIPVDQESATIKPK